MGVLQLGARPYKRGLNCHFERLNFSTSVRFAIFVVGTINFKSKTVNLDIFKRKPLKDNI